MVVCDGLKGLPDAIGEVWPQAVVQTASSTCCAPASATPAGNTGMPSRKRSSRSTPHPPKQPCGRGSTSSPRSEAASIQPSSGSERTPGRSSCQVARCQPADRRTASTCRCQRRAGCVARRHGPRPVREFGFAVGIGTGGFWPSLLATAAVALAFQPHPEHRTGGVAGDHPWRVPAQLARFGLSIALASLLSRTGTRARLMVGSLAAFDDSIPESRQPRTSAWPRRSASSSLQSSSCSTHPATSFISW